jgi:acyl-CoA synthetase (NDP forming)
MVVAYIEGVRDGRRFIDVVKKLSLKKPVFIWKGGLTDMGSRAVASHTASLGGSRAVWDGFFKQTGAIPAVGIDEMIDLMVGFQCLPDFSGRRVCVISGGGAITVAASDALDPLGMTMPPFSDETKETIRGLLPQSGNTVGNPLDTGPPIFLLPTVGQILEAVGKSDRVDIAVVQHEVSAYLPAFVDQMADIVPSVKDKTGKPFAVTMPAPTTSSESMEIEETRRKYREWYVRRGVPVFENFDNAVNILAKIIRYNEFVADRMK